MLRKSLVCFLILSLTPLCQSAIHKHALVIGINGQGLSYAADDATKFAEFIESDDGGGFPIGNVTVLTNEHAKRDNVLEAISSVGDDVQRDQANYPATDQTLVYVFISAHNAPDPTNDDAFLMTWGADFKVPSTGIRSDEFLLEVKTHIGANHVMYFFDTCYAASSENGGSTAKNLPRGFQTRLEEAWEHTFQGVLQQRHLGLFSSGAGQESFEDPDLKHGIFTYYLLKGLGGEADQPPFGNKDGIVTAEELRLYLDKFVPLRAAKFGPQTPQASLIWDGDIPLSQVPLPERYGIYSEGVPAGLVDNLQQQLKNGGKIVSVSIADDSHWAVVGDKETWSNAAGLVDEVNSYNTQFPGGSLRLAVLGGGGCHVLIFGSNGYDPPHCPVELGDVFVEAHKANETIGPIAVDGQNNFIVVVNRNGYSVSTSIPVSLVTQLKQINANNQTIDQIALGANGSWVLVYDSGAGWGASWDGMSPSFGEVMHLLSDRAAPIQAIAVQPNGNSWVIVAPE